MPPASIAGVGPTRRTRAAARDESLVAGSKVDEQTKVAQVAIATARRRPVLNARHDECPHFVKYDFVLSGYRYHFEWPDALKGMFELHAETLNIWTHLAGVIYFLAAYPRVASALASNSVSATLADKLHYYAFVSGGVAQMLASTTYHVFRCMSAEWEAFLLRCDIIGVVAMIGGSYGIALYNGFWAACYPGLYVGYAAVTVSLLAGACLLMTIPAFQEPEWISVRNTVLATSVGFGVVPAVHWALLPACSGECIARYAWGMAGMLIFYATGFVCFLYRIPERWWPGVFDLAGSSHNLWHVCVFAAGACWLEAMISFYGWRVQNPAQCSS